MKYQAEGDRAKVDERRTDQPEVCDVPGGSSETALVLRVTYHAVSLRPPNY